MNKQLNPILCMLLALLSVATGDDSKAKTETSQKVAWLGVATNPYVDKNGKRDGVEIAFVWSRSPASQAGLLEGDIMKTFGEKVIKTPAKLLNFIQKSSPGDQVAIVYERKGKSHTASVKLGKISPEDLPENYIFLSQENVTRINPATLSPEKAEEIWAFIEDETKIMLLDEGFSPEHTSRIIKAIVAGEAELRKTAQSKESSKSE